MNREIKFRGYDSTKWYYGDLEYNKKNDVARIHTYKDDGSYDKQYTVDPNTVGQFTGLCDKNCKDIYEGDIIHLDCVGNFMVWYSKESCSFELRTRINDGGYVDELWSMNCKEYEIVGNIYDDYKLLSKE